MRAALLLALLLVLSACLRSSEQAPAPPPGPAPDPIPTIPLEQDHDHRDPLLHNGSANLELVGYHGGYGSGNGSEIPPNQGFSELFVRNGLAFLGRRGGNDGGFVILDVKDPKHPKLLSSFQGLANYDMESTHDNRFVFFVSQYLNNQQPSSVPPDDPGEAPRAVHVIDISDPKNPKEATAFPVPTRGAHTITYHRTSAGRELLAIQTYDFVPDPSLGLPAGSQGVNPVAQRVEIAEFLRAPAPRLQLLGVFEKHELPPLNTFFPHDVTIQTHPITRQLIMYVAYWDLGAYLVDISDPANPKEISRLNDFSPSKVKEIHLAAPADSLIDGRHITVTEPELTAPYPESGQYTIFDTTDPRNPKRLGHWTLPGDMKNTAPLLFSPHNFEVEDGRLVLAHYHGGVWLVDLHNETLLKKPVALAYAQPSQPRSSYQGSAPDVWTALLDGGLVYASDIRSGLYIYRYTAPEVKADDDCKSDDPSKGALCVHVQDASGKPVADASITLLGTALVGTTDAKGYRNFTSLDPGDYNVRADKQGHSPAEKIATVRAGKGVTVQITIRAA